MSSDSAKRSHDEPVSLAPLTPEEALRALLAVKPDDEPIMYRARAIRWEEGWELDVEGVGMTHLDAIENAEDAVRDYIKTAMGVDATGAEIAIEEVDPHVQDLTDSADKNERPAS